jgi:diguanylate cyclase (GGDEF)-like protein/PAS domain S-box-containing protein
MPWSLNHPLATRCRTWLRSALARAGAPKRPGEPERRSPTFAAGGGFANDPAFHRHVVEQAGDVIWTMDLDGRTTYVNPAVERLRGYRPEEVLTQRLEDVLTPASAATAVRALARASRRVAAGARFEPIHLELEQRCRDGSTVWTEVTAAGLYDGERFVAILGVTRDVDVRREAEARMAHMALHDPLTGLPNRALVQDRVQQAIVSAVRDGERFAVVMLDLDGFKPVNDTYGHAAGDQVLRDVARRLEACVRASDTVGRVGGDEFVLVIRHVTSAADVEAVTRKVHEALAHPFEIDRNLVELACSSGQALYPQDGIDERALTLHADAAMYRAKRAKRVAEGQTFS